MIEELLEMLKEIEQQDELFDVMARCCKKSYDALVKAGFTEDQAARIVASRGVGVKSRVSE